MSRKKSTARTIGIRQIKKNEYLSMGTPQADIAKYEKVITSYGNVAPAIVVEENGMYSLVDGSARLEACARAGMKDIPAVVAEADGEPEQLELSLLLSSSREHGNALSEGALIHKLVKEHGYSLGALSKLLGRSKAWLSKRQAMAANLSPHVKDMVLGGAICTRSAEEVARLPQAEQAKFASNIVKEGINKDGASRLCRLYRSAEATPALRRAIIDAPAEMLMTCPATGRDRSGARPKRRVLGAICYVLGILEELEGLICGTDAAALATEAGRLLKLQRQMQSLINLISACTAVSPGKQGGGAQVD